MKNFKWQWQYAIAPIWHRPLHFFVYFLVLVAFSFSLYVFFNFQNQIARHQDLALTELLGGDIVIDGGYRPFETGERAYFRSISDAHTEEAEFRTMLQFEKPNAPVTRLANVRVVDQYYPLLGTVDIIPALNASDLQERLSQRNDAYGVLISKELADYFDSNTNDKIKISGIDFDIRGIVNNTPELDATSFNFLPYVIISRDAFESLQLNSDEMLLRNKFYLKLPQGTDMSMAADEIRRGYHDNGWQITTQNDFLSEQSGYFTLVKRIAGFVNILVLIGFSISLYSIFKTLLIEDRGSRQQLIAEGATLLQISISYVLRLIVLLCFCFFIILLLGLILSYLARQFPSSGLGTLFGDFSHFYDNMAQTDLIIFLVSMVIAPLALWLNISRKAWRAFLVAILAATALVLYLAPRYKLNIEMIISLLVFIGVIIAYWFVVKFIKRIWRRNKMPTSIRQFALLEFSGKYSAQENFSSLVFANMVIVSCLVGMIFAIHENAERFRNAPKPSHFIADLQPDQLEAFETMLGESGARGMSVYPIIRARITELNNQETYGDDNWLYRGDRIFSADQAGEFDLQKDVLGRYEIALDEQLALDNNIAIGDQMSISVLGEPVELVVKRLRETDISATNVDFLFILPARALDELPHVFLASANFSEEQAPTLRRIVDQYPNVILVATKSAVTRIDAWISTLLGYLAALGLHILTATVIALVSVGVLIMRKERYNQLIFRTIGMRQRDMRRMQMVKIVVNALLTSITSFFVIWAFNRFALSDLVQLDVQISWALIFAIIFGFGLIFAMIPSLILVFDRSDPRKIEEFAQDFTSPELDF